MRSAVPVVPQVEEGPDGIVEPREESRVESVRPESDIERVVLHEHGAMVPEDQQVMRDGRPGHRELRRDHVGQLPNGMIPDRQNLDDAAAHGFRSELERMDHASRVRRRRTAAPPPSTGTGESYQLIGSALPSS